MAQFNRCIPSLGTYVEISLNSETLTEDELIEISILASKAIENVHDEMSFHSPKSLLTTINLQALHYPVPITPSMHEVLNFCKNLHIKTDGAFDPTIASTLQKLGHLPTDQLTPHSSTSSFGKIHLTKDSISLESPLYIDLGGIAKGFAVDQAMKQIPTQVTATINAGGDTRTNNHQGKTIHLRHPKNPSKKIPHPFLTPALATSADYYHEHNPIIDPSSQKTIQNKDSITVFAQDCITADALTKAAFLLSSEKLTTILNSYQAQALILNQTGELKMLNET